MSKERLPLGLRRRVTPTPPPSTKIEIEQKEKIVPEEPKVAKKTAPPKKVQAKKGRPSTKSGKKLMKYSMDIHPELKRAVVKAAAIHDKDVHAMWNEIIFDWLQKEKKKNPDWYATIKVDRSEL